MSKNEVRSAGTVPAWQELRREYDLSFIATEQEALTPYFLCGSVVFSHQAKTFSRHSGSSAKNPSSSGAFRRTASLHRRASLTSREVPTAF